MTDLLIIDPQAEEYAAHLKPRFPEVSIHTAGSGAGAGDLLGEAEVIAIIGPRLMEEDVRKAPKLQWIQALTVGVDNILQFSSLGEDVLITTARGIHGPQMSELAVLLMLSLSRNFPRVVRNQGRRAWERWPQPLLEGRAVGILGVGVVGEAVARKCKAFGMTVAGITSTPREIGAFDRFYTRGELPRAAGEVDFLVVTVPHSPETDKIVGAEVLSAMKPTGFLINLARGGVVDEEALIDALRSGGIAGAGLDVFNEEPLPGEHPLWEMENVIITPHIGGMSENYIEQVLPILEENLHHFVNGDRRSMINIVKR
ncbi:MAG: D-2-hydroxyacid dehydrogenase [bacterium]